IGAAAHRYGWCRAGVCLERIVHEGACRPSFDPADVAAGACARRNGGLRGRRFAERDPGAGRSAGGGGRADRRGAPVGWSGRLRARAGRCGGGWRAERRLRVLTMAGAAAAVGGAVVLARETAVRGTTRVETEVSAAPGA